MANQQQRQTAVTSAAALIAAQQAAVLAVRSRVAAFIRMHWRGLPNYRDAQVGKFVASVLPMVEGGQRQVASITDAYLSHLYAQMTGAPAQMVGVPTSDVTGLRQGADPADVYTRPFTQVWTELSQGVPFDNAVQDGERRALNLAATDLQLAKQHAALKVLGHQEHVVGYRRVLEGTYSCGLCVVASTARYHKAELMPIHPGCDCGVAPIIGDHDPGRIINQPLLEQAHAAISDTFGRDSSAARVIPGAKGSKGKPISYRDVIVTHEHGELGPVLGVRGQSFTGRAEVARHKHVKAS